MFADTGIPAFLATLCDQGADVKQMKIVVAGAARIMGQTGFFNIGEKNYEAVRKILSGNNLQIQHEHIGGTSTRTLSLNIGDGFNTIKILGEGEINI
jgi:chemotaxis protein CheD